MTLFMALVLFCFMTCTNTSDNGRKTYVPFIATDDVDFDSLMTASEASLDSHARAFDSIANRVEARKIKKRKPPELRPAKPDTIEIIETHQSPHGRWFEQ